MKTEWDYSTLADAYLQRPDYSAEVIDAIVRITQVGPGSPVCDVGAGVAHLSRMLADRGLVVTSVEPNDAMRANGLTRTASYTNIHWFEGTGEQTGQPDRCFKLVTFGSSFNVVHQRIALVETARILSNEGWFVCLWNHRCLGDPVQAEIERIIHKRVPNYSYGTRRDDQTEVIEASGLFGPVIQVCGRVTHEQTVDACVKAWRSHATLSRQAGDAFDSTIQDIANYLNALGTDSIEVPYMTTSWLAQLK